ncbi:hypothetical protein GWC95_15480 [Sediminibacterium roseum]|uniref:Uncharacterized protein n=1 Tax=Sediminibacterium roseum TaxID=1978412 RepID=A0ABW9ZW10_9BACT|nr:hypothetical protein [Sediminibacterium roseum]NCI51329.1 hypothetical protein [Sediminibacterium roseum]
MEKIDLFKPLARIMHYSLVHHLNGRKIAGLDVGQATDIVCIYEEPEPK